MNDFYVTLTGEIFYLWITLNAPSYDVDGVSVLYQEEKWRYVIYFESQERFGNVFIWNNNVVEEQIYNKSDGSSIFYLHFEIDNIGQCRYLFLEFYRSLKKRTLDRRYRALVCCSGGLTSCLFSTRLQELADLKHYNLRIDATAFTRLKEKYETYDMILLAPQVAHYKARILNKIPKSIPIHRIDPTAYATMSLDSTFDLICTGAKSKGLLE